LSLAAALLTAGLLASLALLATLLAPLLTLPSLLLALPLPLLPPLALLTALAQRVQIVTQALQPVESRFAARTLPWLAFLSAESLLCLTQLIVEPAEGFANFRFTGCSERTVTLVDPVGAALEHILQIGIFDAGERVAQLGGSVTVR
jgi:hypothetical protein